MGEDLASRSCRKWEWERNKLKVKEGTFRLFFFLISKLRIFQIFKISKEGIHRDKT